MIANKGNYIQFQSKFDHCTRIEEFNNIRKSISLKYDTSVDIVQNDARDQSGEQLSEMDNYNLRLMFENYR